VKNAVNDYDRIFGPGYVPTRYTIALTGANHYDLLQLKNCGGRNQPGIIQMTDVELSEILHPPRDVAPIPNALPESIVDAHNPSRAQHIYGESQASVDRHYNQEFVLGNDPLNVIEGGERLAREGLCRLRCRELQRLHISTARINYKCTYDDWLAVGGRMPLLQPTCGDPNYVMMLANLALIMPNRDWIEEYVCGVEAHLPAAGIHEEYERRQAICLFCRYAHKPNNVYSLKLEVDADSGKTIRTECFVCNTVEQKYTYRCCNQRQSSCLECAKKTNFAPPQEPHDPYAPPLPPIPSTQLAPPTFEPDYD
jgi:hypothetical protein